MFSQLHAYSTFFTRYLQDPLKANVGKIVDPLGEKRKAGTLTYEDVIAGQQSLENELAAFNTTADSYAQLGDSQAYIRNRAKATLDPIFADWHATFANDLLNLKPPKTETAPPVPEEAPSLNTILGGGQTPENAALNAANTVRKQARGNSYRATMLTGPRGLQSRVPVQRQKILGY